MFEMEHAAVLKLTSEFEDTEIFPFCLEGSTAAPDGTVVRFQAEEIAVSNEGSEPCLEGRMVVANAVGGRRDGARMLGVEGPMDGATTVGLDALAARACISAAMSSALLSMVDLTIMIGESPPSTTS